MSEVMDDDGIDRAETLETVQNFFNLIRLLENPARRPAPQILTGSRPACTIVETFTNEVGHGHDEL